MIHSFITGFLAGFAATPHCLGMCGGFPLHLASKSAKGRLLTRQFLFVLGKTFTYVFLGVLAAGVGTVVFRDTTLASKTGIVRLAAGVLIVVLGLGMMGLRLPRTKPLKYADTGFVRSLFNSVLSYPGPAAALVLGLMVGFLPCPLPMGMLAISAASGNVFNGMALMAGVGAGTAPGLLAVGLFGSGLDKRFAKVGMRIAGLVVIAMGLLLIGRATGIIHAKSAINKAVPSCCQGHQK